MNRIRQELIKYHENLIINEGDAMLLSDVEGYVDRYLIYSASDESRDVSENEQLGSISCECSDEERELDEWDKNCCITCGKLYQGNA